jgi:hypothetical protein
MQQNLEMQKKYFHVNILHPLGWTAPQLAAVNGNAEAVKAVLKADDDSDFSDEFINTHRTGFEIGLHATDIIRQEYEFNAVLSKCASFHGLTTLYYAVTIEDIVVVRAPT